MRAPSLIALTVTGLWILACGGGDEPEDPFVPDPESGEIVPGQIHVHYPTAALSAEPGQFVLAPSRDMLDQAFQESGGGFIWYAGHVQEPGEVESMVKSLAGVESTIPNTLIIPIRPGQQAASGDVLLGHWESGSGMRRAFVTGGSPTAPTVRYLDRPYDKAKQAEQKEDTFQPDRFHALTAAWQIGTTVACADGEDRKHGILMHDAGERILVSTFAGGVEAKDRSDCVSIPPRQSFEPGETVWIPVVGSYREGKVTALDAAVGRVWVAYTWGGSEREEAFPMVDVAKSFDDGEAEDTQGQPPSEGARQGSDIRQNPRPDW